MGRRNVFLVSLALSIGAVLYIRPENIQTVRRKLLLVENEAEPENDTATEEEGSPKRELWFTLQNVGNNGKPPYAFPLAQCQGDCDNDNECAGYLKCFQRGNCRNCAPEGSPVPGCYGQGGKGTDYCVDPADLGGHSPYSPPPPPPPPPAPQYGSSTYAQVGNNGKPPHVFPLQMCQGDCDNDNECAGTLRCFKRGTRNIPGNTPVPGCHGYAKDGVDFCYAGNAYPQPTPRPYEAPTMNPYYPPPTPRPYYPPPTPRPYYPPPTPRPYYPPPTPRPYYPQPTPAHNNKYLAEVGNNGKPPNVFPLQSCQGDCDGDYECAYGLTCFQRRGSEPVPGCYGFARNGIDFCISTSKPKPTPMPYYPKPTPYPYYPKPTPYPYYAQPTPRPTPYYTHTQEPSMTDVPTRSQYRQWTFHE